MTDEQLDIIIAAQTASFDKKLAGANTALESAVERAGGFSLGAQPQSVRTDYESGYMETFGAAAGVLELNAPQTLIGAFTQGGTEKSSAAPIEIHTTVELDGDAIGESVALYNDSRSRITNGAAE
nr:MAG TPA: hypothetical protein [Caudoviricetes sp.]